MAFVLLMMVRLYRLVQNRNLKLFLEMLINFAKHWMVTLALYKGFVKESLLQTRL